MASWSVFARSKSQRHTNCTWRNGDFGEVLGYLRGCITVTWLHMALPPFTALWPHYDHMVNMVDLWTDKICWSVALIWFGGIHYIHLLQRALRGLNHFDRCFNAIGSKTCQNMSKFGCLGQCKTDQNGKSYKSHQKSSKVLGFNF